MELQVEKGPLTQATFDKALALIKAALEKYDFDSNTQANGRWLAIPSANIITHNLGVIGTTVHVYIADDAEGTNATFTTWWDLTRSTITIAPGSKGYCRVLINK